MIRFMTAVLLMGFVSSPVLADIDPSSDATTPMEERSGNLSQSQDNTLSDTEVKRLQNNAAHGVVTPPPAGEDVTTTPDTGRPMAPANPASTTQY